MKASVQLYSLRNEVESLGLEAVLDDVREAGFDAVETAGFYNLKTEKIKSLLERRGLVVSGMHIGLDEILRTSIVESAASVGFQNVIVPHIAFSELKNNFADVTRRMNSAMDICVKNGLELSYHNHAHEFYCGDDFLKKLIDSVQGLKIELDIFWLAVGGKNLTQYYPTIKDSLSAIHIKELSGDGAGSFSQVPGQGYALCNEAKQLAKAHPLNYLTLEFEKINTPHPLYLKSSCSFLKE